MLKRLLLDVGVVVGLCGLLVLGYYAYHGELAYEFIQQSVAQQRMQQQRAAPQPPK